MEIIVQRTSPKDSDKTRGLLSIKDAALTLEDTVRTGQKVQGQTALPAGRYRVTLENSPRFGPDTLTLTGFIDGDQKKGLYKTPGTTATHTGVRVHGGNTVQDTDGCPMVGLEYTKDGIANCAPAVDALEIFARAVLGVFGLGWWEIKDAFD